MASIRLEKVDKVFSNRRVVCSLDLSVADGELVVLLGPSGCGKTTILRMIAGLETPAEGRIYLNEHEITYLPPQKRDLAMVFQSHTLYPHKTVRDNLGFSLRLQGINSREIAERVRQVAQTLGLASLLDQRPGQLSGGERQRVALGRALVRRPRALLLDEPLSNLDAQLRVQLRNEIARLHRQSNLTTLYVTHDQEEAMMLGERVAVLREGTLQQTGPPLEVYRRPANLFVAGFTGSPAMNLFRATISRGTGGNRLEAPWISGTIECNSELFANRGEVVVGIRPHEIRLAELSASDAQIIIESVTPRAQDVVILASLQGNENYDRLTIVATGDSKLAIQERVGVVFPRDRLHFFDPVSGNRLH